MRGPLNGLVIRHYAPVGHVVSHSPEGPFLRKWTVWLESHDTQDPLYGELAPRAHVPWRRLALWWAGRLDKRRGLTGR